MSDSKKKGDAVQKQKKRVVMTAENEQLVLEVLRQEASRMQEDDDSSEDEDQQTQQQQDAAARYKKNFKKLNLILDEVTKMGFKKEHVEQVIRALMSEHQGNMSNVTVNDALDWLFIHVPHNELPKKFADQRATASAATSDSVKFFSYSATAPQPSSTTTTRTTPALPVVPTAPKRDEKAEKEKQQKDKKAQAEWIKRYLEHAEEEEEQEEIEQKRLLQEKRRIESMPPEVRIKELQEQLESETQRAREAKASGDKAAQSEVMKKIKDLRAEIKELEEKIATSAKKAPQQQKQAPATTTRPSSTTSTKATTTAALPPAKTADSVAALSEDFGGFFVEPESAVDLNDNNKNNNAVTSTPQQPKEAWAAQPATTYSYEKYNKNNKNKKAAPVEEDTTKPKWGKKTPAAATAAAAEKEADKKQQKGKKGAKQREEEQQEDNKKQKGGKKPWGGKKGEEAPTPAPAAPPPRESGKKAKAFFHEFCQKRQWGQPQYERVYLRGCPPSQYQFKLSVTDNKKKKYEFCLDTEWFPTLQEAHNAVCAYALYQLNPNQPLHLLLTPTYREMWLRWVEQDKQAKKQKEEESTQQRKEFIDKLLFQTPSSDKKQQPPQAQATPQPQQQERQTKKQQQPQQQISTPSSWEEHAAPESANKAKSQKDGRKANDRDEQIRQLLLQKQRSDSQYRDMQKQRERLPVYSFMDKITKAVAENQVVVISGETGSGKSTQIPQFVLDDMILSLRGTQCNIICTQPRRISAVALAERVAAERAEKVGESVGYQIRLEAKRDRDTKLLYCTTGVLLRRMQDDPELKSISHVIIDEVHERSVQSDFLMLLLKDLMLSGKRPDLRIILMSATLNAELFANYFGKCEIVTVPGKIHPIEDFYLEDAFEMTRHVIEPDSFYAKKSEHGERRSVTMTVTGARGNKTRLHEEWDETDIYDALVPPPVEESEDMEEVADDDDNNNNNNNKASNKDGTPAVNFKQLYANYSASTQRSLARVDEDKINYDLIQDILVHIDDSDKFRDAARGAVLIFMPGLKEISALYDQLQFSERFGDKSKYLILPLHSVLSSADQHLIFDPAPPHIRRKIVIATNIAETSITIDDVVFVIDTGRVKETQYDSMNRMAVLVETWISQASARQRKGRAGRVRSGYCFHLYTKYRHDKLMAPHQVPEMLRTPLESLLLHIGVSGLAPPESGGLANYLNKAIEPPSPSAVQSALQILEDISALEKKQTVTPLGVHLSKLPVDVRIGKMIIFGAIFRCLDPILTIAALMSYRSPFVSPLDKREEARAAHKAFRTADSDLLTVLTAYNKWKDITRQKDSASNKMETEFCRKNFLSRTTLLQIDEMKEQFASLLDGIGFIDLAREAKKDDAKATTTTTTQVSQQLQQQRQWDTPLVYNVNSDNVALLKAVITAGLYPNVLRIELSPDRLSIKLHSRTPGEDVRLHPGSINHGVNVFPPETPWMVFHQKMKTTRIYVHDSTVVSSYPLLLFGSGDIEVQHTQNALLVDGWLQFHASAKTAVLFKELRKLLNKLLKKKIKNPEIDIYESSPVIQSIIKLLTTEHAE